MWESALWAPVRSLARWPVTTQVGARRNALLASTALTQRRREYDEVAEYVGLVKHHAVPRSAEPEAPLSV